MQELTEFLKAGTEFFKTATVYLNMKATADKLIAAPKEPTKPAAAKEKAPKAEKPAAEKPAAKAKTVEEVMGAQAPQMSEKESLDTCYKLAQKHLESCADKETAKKALIEHLTATYNKKNISGLTHPERVEFAEYLKNLDAAPAEAGMSL